MKLRDWLCLIVLAAVLLAALQPAPSPRPDRPALGFVARVLTWVGLRVFLSEPPAVPNYEAQPQALVNTPPTREVGADGMAKLDHGAAW